MKKKETKDSCKVERLYHQYKNLMYQEAYQILKDATLAEDALQQSFLKIIDNIDKIEEKEVAKTRNFVVIICRNTAFDILKHRTYLNNHDESIDIEVEEDNELVDVVEPSQVVINSETVNIMKEAIKNLPEIYRNVILLEFLHEYSKEEIATLLNVSYETVKKRSMRARKMLAKALEKEGLK